MHAADAAWEDERFTAFLELTDAGSEDLGVQVRRARALRQVGRWEEAASTLAAWLDEAERRGGAVLIDVLAERSYHAGTSETLERAMALAVGDEARLRPLRALLAEHRTTLGQFRAAEATLADAPDADDDPDVAYVRAEIAAGRQALDDADRWYRRAEALARGRRHPEAVGAMALARRGALEFTRGRRDEARACFERALAELPHPDGWSRVRAHAHNGLAECARAAGDLEAAEAGYRAALAAQPWELYRVNLAIVALERGHVAEARTALLAGSSRLGVPVVAAAAALGLAACAAHDGDAAAFDRALHPFVAAAPSVNDPDLARLAAMAAAWGQRHRGWEVRALRCRRVALEVWRHLGREREAQAEERALRRLADRGVGAPLGPFVLESPLARGAFGQVWRATWGDGIGVAVKILAPSVPAAVVERELRAVAALRHPNVVRLLDHGRVDRAAAVMLPTLVEGASWIATELAPDGTLEPHLGIWDWPRVRDALLAVLDALAHSHARGLLHLDVKPANVLLADGVPKLADFGLARAAEAGDGALAGTPAYMAPEQFGGVEALGPWTDLYAVGCLAAALVSGAPPFGGTTLDALRSGHLEGQPAVRPRRPVPAAFLPWVRRLLAKRPEDRFRRAADAARALLSLGPAVSADGTLVPDDAEAAPTVVLPARDPDAVPTVDVVGERIAVPAPTVPAGWARPDAPPPPLTDAGLGLFGLRAAPFVGREVARSVLWAGLRDVVHRGVARAALIEGAPGLGSSALAAWLCERSHEVGAATVLAVHQRGGDGPGRALPRALARAVQCEGVSGEELRIRLSRWFPGVAAAEIGLLGDVLDASPTVGPGERRKLLARAIGRSAGRRPIVLWIDRASRDREALGVVEELVGRPVPVFAVLTDHPGALPDRLHDLSGSVSVPLSPLTDAEQRELLSSLLALAPETLDRLARSTAGDPRFAVQLLTELVAGGDLEATLSGAAFRGRIERELPTSLAGFWARRVRGALSQVGRSAREALRVAALLEPDVDDRAWELACGHAGLPFAPEGRDVLVGARLATPRDGGFGFEDPAIRAAILGGVPVEALHAACAAALAERGMDAARIATHWEAAGRPDRALGVWPEAIAQRARLGDPEADVLGERLLKLAEALPEREAARVRIEVLSARGRSARQDVRFVDARAAHEEVRRIALAHGDRDAADDAVVHLAGVERRAGHPPTYADELLRIAHDCANAETRTLAMLELGRDARNRGRDDDARRWFDEAVALSAGLSANTRSAATGALGSLLGATGDAAAALPWIELSRADADGPLAKAILGVSVAAVMRQVGRFDDAERMLIAAEEVLDALGSWAALLAATVRVLTLWMAGRRVEGDRLAADTVARPDLAGTPVEGLAARIDLVIVAHRDEAMFEAAFARVVAVKVPLAVRGEGEECLAMAERRAREAGRTDRAERIAGLR